MTKSEYIKELPENIFEIIFSYYWWDDTNQQLIIKDKRNIKYKIVHFETQNQYKEKEIINSIFLIKLSFFSF